MVREKYFDSDNKISEKDIDLWNSDCRYLGYRKFSISKLKQMIKNGRFDIMELYLLGAFSYIAFAALHYLGEYNVWMGPQKTEWGKDTTLYMDENNAKEWYKKYWLNNKNKPKVVKYYEMAYPEIIELLADWSTNKIINKDFPKEKLDINNENRLYENPCNYFKLIDREYLVKFLKMELSREEALDKQSQSKIKKLKDLISEYEEKTTM